MYRSNSVGRLFPDTPELVVDAPADFFCPLSGCLMIEPVRLCNSGQVCAPPWQCAGSLASAVCVKDNLQVCHVAC